VVAVDGTPITKAAFNHWLSVATFSSASGAFAKNVTVPDPPNYTKCIAHFKEINEGPEKGKKLGVPEIKQQCELQYKGLSQEVTGFLISSQWIIGEANALGVKVSDKEVAKQFEKIKNQQFPKAADFEKFLTTSGQTVSDLLLRVKGNMLSQKIQAKIVKDKSKVSQAQIAKYYNEHKSNYGQQEKRTAEIVVTKTEAAAKSAKKEIESGKSFASVAKSRSTDPAVRRTSGQLGEQVKGQQEAALDKAIFSAKANTLEGPIKGAFGYYILDVTSIVPGNQQSLSQASASIKSQLSAQQQQTVLAKFVKDFKKKWKAKTDCRKEYVVANCKQFKEPKKGTGTAPTGTGTTPTGTTPTGTTSK
jgi:parvulin-like peptidyl-prolyl isomerase